MKIKQPFPTYTTLLLLSLTIFSGCQSTVSKWPSNDSKQLGTIIRFPFQPQRARWQPISLPVKNGEDDRSIPGPTDMVGVVAILTFDGQTVEAMMRDAGPLASDQGQPSVYNAFIFDWYPQALREHFVASESGSARVVTLQGYRADLFVKSSAKNIRGSFFTRIPGTADLFLYYQSW